MPKGLLNPKNYAQDTGGGGFKEGFVRVDRSVFKVHQAPPRGGEVLQPVCALAWDVTRLDEDLEPLLDDSGAPITELLPFSLGGKSLPQVHPGGADSIDDEDVQDLLVAVGTEGPTIFLVNPEFKINPKSSAAHLFASLIKVDSKMEEIVDRTWAPDYAGMVVFLKSIPDPTVSMADAKGVTRPTNFKTVDKIVKSPGQAKTKGAAAGKDGGANSETESALKSILEALSHEMDGKQLTLKALNTRVSRALQAGKVDTKLHIPTLALAKDAAWLKKNAEKYDMTVDFEAGTVVFGILAEAQA